MHLNDESKDESKNTSVLSRGTYLGSMYAPGGNNIDQSMNLSHNESANMSKNLIPHTIDIDDNDASNGEQRQTNVMTATNNNDNMLSVSQVTASNRASAASAANKKTNYYDARFWERQHLDWKEGKGPRPGPHPNPENTWNTKPELHDYGDDDDYGDEVC